MVDSHFAQDVFGVLEPFCILTHDDMWFLFGVVTHHYISASALQGKRFVLPPLDRGRINDSS